MWNWLLHTTSGQWTRIAIGASIFIALAVVDLRRNGQRATRWREYLLLLVAVATAVFYGVINDQLTCTISWEYFYYGKEIYKVVGPETPPADWPFRWEVAKVGIMATWSVGLILGVILLVANNPIKNWPRLSYRTLLRCLITIVLISITFGIIGGLLGYQGFLTNLSPDFQDMTRANVFRPKNFICTWGIHLGGYVGGIVGTITCALWMICKRANLKFQPQATASGDVGVSNAPSRK